MRHGFRPRRVSDILAAATAPRPSRVQLAYVKETNFGTSASPRLSTRLASLPVKQNAARTAQYIVRTRTRIQAHGGTRSSWTPWITESRYDGQAEAQGDADGIASVPRDHVYEVGVFYQDKLVYKREGTTPQ